MLMDRGEDTLTKRLRARMVEAKALRVAAINRLSKRKRLATPTGPSADVKIIYAELGALDLHDAACRKLMKKSESQETQVGLGPNAGADYRLQELSKEIAQLGILRSELAADMEYPVTHERDGPELTDATRALRNLRTKEISENKWTASEKAESHGDFRQARELRHDALRARHIAEHELHLRSSLRGYSFAG